MSAKENTRRDRLLIAGGLVALAVSAMWLSALCQQSQASPPGHGDDAGPGGWAAIGREQLQGPQALAGTWYNLPGPEGAVADSGVPDGCAKSGKFAKLKRWFAKPCGGGCADSYGPAGDVGGSWFWMRSPEQERVVVAALFNRYCIRCHGVDGRGVWDIPGVPDFTNARWQACRSDAQLVRATLEGRGAVMPPFRGTMTLEEAWAMARYLRTFVPGTEVSRPDATPPAKPAALPANLPAPPP